jgi:dipeptidyl aminopeptidase/acylaminoacyl peptidase
MTSETKVHFYSDGQKLAGVLTLPEGPGPHPGIVLCHGFTGIKELILPDYAGRFVEAGFAALTFDYHGFGESEGPRGRLIAMEQVRDIRNAITFLQSRPEVDAERIGLWGTSYGGAHAPYVAGIDDRVKCAVAQVGFGDGGRLFRRNASDAQMKVMRTMLEADRRQRVLTGKGAMLDPLQMLSDEDSVAFFTEAAKDLPQIQVQIPVETAEATMEYKPEEVVDRISPRALLLIAVEHDMPCPKEEYESMYARAGEPKKLVVRPGLRHYDVYGGEGLQKTASLAVDWFRQHLS